MLDGLRRAFGFESAALLHATTAGWAVEAASGSAPPSPDAAELVVEVDAEHVLVARAGAAPDRGPAHARGLRQGAGGVGRARGAGGRGRQRRGLAAVNELRASILSSVSHDLRTPLSSIKASATSLLQDDIDWTPEAEHELLTTIDEETDRLNRLVGNLLDMSRLQTGALEVSAAVVLARRGACRGPREHRRRRRRVVLDVPEDIPPVLGDEALLERAVANIIANALAYSPRRAGARDRRRRCPGVDVRVVDRGPGVPPHERERIFQPFQRLGDTRRRDGVGLGLADREGLRRGDGRYDQADDTPGGGLTIVVRLKVER